jgi:DNA-binding response OmpR family regulator
VPTVLVIDDEDEVRLVVRRVLERADLGVIDAPGGRQGLRLLYQQRPDVVILDVAMPGLDGWQTLERVREVSDVPVMMLSAHDDELDRVRGLRLGADDYIGKPFGPRELAARVHALLRRVPGGGRTRETVDTGYLRLVPAAREVSCGGRRVDLTPLEFRLITALAAEAGVAVPAERLVRAVWGGPEGVEDGQLSLVVSRLRKKLGTDPRTGESPVETVRGFGYRLHQDGDPDAS